MFIARERYRSDSPGSGTRSTGGGSPAYADPLWGSKIETASLFMVLPWTPFVTSTFMGPSAKVFEREMSGVQTVALTLLRGGVREACEGEGALPEWCGFFLFLFLLRAETAAGSSSATIPDLLLLRCDERATSL